MNMLANEWDWGTALEVREEEGFERGRMEGRGEGRGERDRELLNLLAQGYTPEDIVREIQTRTANSAP